MMTSAANLVTIEFTPELFRPATAYTTIGALVDMALTAAGATIAELDLCDTALRELLSSLGSAGPVLRASVSLVAPQLELVMHSTIAEISPTSRELLELGFSSVDISGHVLRCTFVPAGGVS